MRLSVRHVTTYRYDPPTPAAMRLTLWPARHDGQRPAQWRVTVNDAPVPPDFTDPWGDAVATLLLRDPVDALEIVAEGVVETEDRAGVLTGLTCATPPGVCLRETPRTRADAAIATLAEEATAEGAPLARAHALAAAVRAAVAYDPEAADPAATAAAALKAGAGVCQDHAHILIAAARRLGWPARYVAGYLAPDGAAEAASALATHAWAEIWVDGLGWVGFDAANGLCPTDAFVRLCAGLDAADAAPIRGHIAPQSEETLDVAVTVAETAQQRQQ